MINKVLVYGSLMRAYYNHRLLSGSKYMGTRSTLPNFTMYCLGAFPAVSYPGKTSIQGELYAVNQFTMKRLDSLEGCPDFYDRCVVKLNECNDLAWMYYIPEKRIHNYNPTIITTGKWTYGT